MSVIKQSPEAVLRQIDAIMEELQTLRQTVQALLPAESFPEPVPAQGAQVLIIASDGTVKAGSAESLPKAIHEKNPMGVSAWDIIQAAPGQRQFRSAEDVAHYLREERSAWED